MLDKTEYWLDLCDDDLVTAKALYDAGRLLHMGFFCHLIAEKALKATVAKKTNEIPPKTHDLRRLAEAGCVVAELSNEQLGLLQELTPLQIEARYPAYKDAINATLTKEYCNRILSETEAFLCWIKQRLER